MIIHQFSVPADVTNPDTIRRHIRDKLTELDAPAVPFNLLSKGPKDNKIPVLFNCKDQLTKGEFTDCMKGAGFSVSAYNNPFMHKFMSNARKQYLASDSDKISIPKNKRHVMLRTNYTAENILVFIKADDAPKWSLIETLSIPIAKKWISVHVEQTCVSRIIDVTSSIPTEFN